MRETEFKKIRVAVLRVNWGTTQSTGKVKRDNERRKKSKRKEGKIKTEEGRIKIEERKRKTDNDNYNNNNENNKIAKIRIIIMINLVRNNDTLVTGTHKMERTNITSIKLLKKRLPRYLL